MAIRASLLVATAALFGASALLAQTYVYPSKGQSAEQQKKDEGECGAWATGQTGYDPTKPPPAAAPASAPPPAAPAPTGARVKGAAAGATMAAVTDNDKSDAAVVGAVAGGMGQRSAQRQAAAKQQQATAAQQQQAAQAQAKAQANYGKARSACLEGRGYTIK